MKAQRGGRRLRVSTGVISVLALVALLVALAPVFVAQTSWGSTGRNGDLAEDSSQATWYLPEGSSAWGFECWLLIQNPNDKEAVCNVTYMIEYDGPKTVEKRIPANARKTYNMADKIKDNKAAIMVERTTPDRKIMVERAMYWNSRGAGRDTIGGYAD